MKDILKRIPKKAFILCVILALLQAFGELLLPTLTARIVDDGVAQGNIPVILQTGAVMFAVTLFIIATAFGNVYIAAQTSQNLGRELRNEIYQKVLYFSNDEVNTFGTASLITRSSSDIVQLEFTTMLILRIVIFAPAMLVTAVIMAVMSSPQLSMIYLFTAPVLILALGLILRKVSPLFKAMQEKVDKLNLVFREGLTGIRVVRAFNRSDYEADRFRLANNDYTETSIRANVIMAALMPIMVTVISLTNILSNWYGAQLISDGVIQVGVIISFVTYSAIIMFSFMQFAFIFILLPRAQVSADRINKVLYTDNSIDEVSEANRIELGTFEGLKINQMSYRFKGAERNVLSAIDFEVNPGETLAIIGGTGAGKSTIAHLILRLYDVTQGNITINQQDIQNVSLHQLRDYIGYVPQKANLFKGTIRENLRYGNQQATDEQLWKALTIAQADDFVSALPNGLDSEVDQGGNNFSGGQKQRLSIARALVKEAPIYIFDDSFSALDYSTDAKLRKALKPMTKESATIIIAQRVSTIRNADKIIVLENGEIVGFGTHDSLLENDVYREIVESQERG